MRILLLGHNIDKTSGWGRYASNVLNYLKKEGENVDIYTEQNNVDVTKNLLPADSLLNIIKNIIKVRKDSKNYDIIHALEVWPYIIYAHFAVIGTNKRIFVTGIGTYSIVPLESLSKGWILKLALKRAQKIFCISSYVKKELDKRTHNLNTEVVHLGLSPLPKVSIEVKHECEQKFLTIPIDSSPKILTVGAIKHRKGQFDTLQAIQKLLPKYPNLLYIMVGSKNEKEYINLIEEYVKVNNMEKNIRILSNVENDTELSYFYEISDLFVMNSNNTSGHFEGFGLVFLEAESFGKPVVGSSNCGIEDSLKDNYNGYLTKQGDHFDIAEKIHKALVNKEFLGKNSLEFVKNFTWEETVSKYIESYSKD